jgi:gliding motility-associated-like protein
VQIKFLKLGTISLVAEILQTCLALKDTLQVSVSSENIQLSIEGRKSICPQDSTVLTASAGFENYVWNTGQNTRSITVSTAGKYTLIAVSACGGTYRDSVVVSVVNPTSVISYHDTSACLNTSISLSATPGFVSYVWRSAIRPPVSERIITFSVQQNEKLFIDAVDSSGCLVKDSVTVKAIIPASFSLGSDTATCANDSLRLQTPTWLTSVQWNTGASGNSIVVRNAGLYFATGSDSSGCTIRDSMRITALLPVPVLDLGNSGPVCTNNPAVLDAGVQEAYLWNDGSANRFLTVNTPGFYSVQVRNAQGCSIIDSIQITAFNPLPTNFLNPEDSICNYETLRLEATRRFNAYLWSTGATTPSIVVSQPGIYRLLVTDANGCRGADSTRIFQKKCLEGVFVPNAFTPNKDGKNDGFKPLVFLSVEYFEFWVFNRWGEIVFQTVTIGKGWDGTFKGKEMPSGNFIWKCAYRERGKTTEVLKGNVILLR